MAKYSLKKFRVAQRAETPKTVMEIMVARGYPDLYAVPHPANNFNNEKMYFRAFHWVWE